MKQFIRILVVVLGLAGAVAWTIFSASVWQPGHSFTGFGVGDGAGGGSGSGGTELFEILLVGVVWLLPVSPYLCMAAGSLKLITGKWLFIAFVYSLVMLTLLTLLELLFFQRAFKLIAAGNIVAGGLWAYSFRGAASVPGEPEKPQ
jgi:hypothetical protein